MSLITGGIYQEYLENSKYTPYQPGAPVAFFVGDSGTFGYIDSNNYYVAMTDPIFTGKSWVDVNYNLFGPPYIAAIANDGYIVISQDDGLTWYSASTIPTLDDFRMIYWDTHNYLRVFGKSSSSTARAFITQDYGSNWTAIISASTTGPIEKYVKNKSSLDAMYITNLTLWQTTEINTGGFPYTPTPQTQVTEPVGASMDSIAMASTINVVIGNQQPGVGVNDKNIIFTYYSGTTFTPYDVNSSSPTNDVVMENFGSYHRTLSVHTNGGVCRFTGTAMWNNVLQSTENVNAGYRLWKLDDNATTIICCGENGGVYISNNDGKSGTWTAITTNNSSIYRSCALIK
jgi:hypothetical protein